MIEDGELTAFRTPGGHLRISIESVNAVKGETTRPLPNPSSTLQNRRERLEELHLQAQELRAQHQLDELRREHEEEEADRRGEEEAFRQERRDQARAGVIEQRRAERQEDEERERRCSAQEEQLRGQRFVSGWLEVALKEIPPGVPVDLRLEATRKVTALLQECRLQDWLLILQMVSATVANVLVPWHKEREIAAIIEEAQHTLPHAARGLPWSPTEWDLKATQAALSAIADLRGSGSLQQIRTAATLAIKPVIVEYEARQRADKLASQKANSLEHWFLYSELSSYVRQLLNEHVIELEPGETAEDVVSGLEPAIRRHLDQHLTGTETRPEVLALLRELVRADFKL